MNRVDGRLQHLAVVELFQLLIERALLIEFNVTLTPIISDCC